MTTATHQPINLDASAGPKIEKNLAVFWDYENCPRPSSMLGNHLVETMIAVMRPFGSVAIFKAYSGSFYGKTDARSGSLRSQLQSSGVTLVDCPHNGRKDAADRIMMVDMLTYALDHPPPSTIAVISGDRDFAYALSALRLRHYEIVLISPQNAHPTLLAQASTRFDWKVDVLKVAGRRQKAESVASLPVKRRRADVPALDAVDSDDDDDDGPRAPKRRDAGTSKTKDEASQDWVADDDVEIALPQSAVTRDVFGFTEVRHGDTKYYVLDELHSPDAPNHTQLPIQPPALGIQAPGSSTEHLADNPSSSVGVAMKSEQGPQTSSLRQVPPVFSALVECLEAYVLQSQGAVLCPRSYLRKAIKKRHIKALGFPSLDEYLLAAQRAGILDFGGIGDLSWVSFRD